MIYSASEDHWIIDSRVPYFQTGKIDITISGGEDYRKWGSTDTCGLGWWKPVVVSKPETWDLEPKQDHTGNTCGLKFKTDTLAGAQKLAWNPDLSPPIFILKLPLQPIPMCCCEKHHLQISPWFFDYNYQLPWIDGDYRGIHACRRGDMQVTGGINERGREPPRDRIHGSCVTR